MFLALNPNLNTSAIKLLQSSLSKELGEPCCKTGARRTQSFLTYRPNSEPLWMSAGRERAQIRPWGMGFGHPRAPPSRVTIFRGCAAETVATELWLLTAGCVATFVKSRRLGHAPVWRPCGSCCVSGDSRRKRASVYPSGPREPLARSGPVADCADSPRWLREPPASDSQA